MLMFALASLVIYALALIASLPARLLLKTSDKSTIWLAVAGTVWNGEAALAQGHGIRWTWSPLGSLANFAFTSDLEVTGPDTALKGRIAWRPGGATIRDLKGPASATLVSALVPSLPFVCDFPMRVNIDRFAVGNQQPGAAGEIRSNAGSCATRGGVLALSAAVPPLKGEATTNVGGSNGFVSILGRPSERLVNYAVTPNGRTSVTVLPAASAYVPGGQALGPFSF